MVKKDLEGLQTSNGPYAQTFMATVSVDKTTRTATLHGRALCTQKAKEGFQGC